LAALLTGAAVVSAFALRGDGGTLPYEEPHVYSDERGTTAPPPTVTVQEIVREARPEAPLPVSYANLDKPILEVWSMVDEISALINAYHSNHSQTVLFLSKNGYLFDVPANAYVFVSQLYGLIDIDERFLEESIMFFYFRPIDLARYRNLNVSQQENLVIFTGFETREGFAITGPGEQGGIISREDLGDILDRYSWNHGEIRKIYNHSDTHYTVMRALTAYTGSNAGFDIRYMYRDDRYICVVASPRDDFLNISMFILEYIEGAVFVRLSNIEGFDDYRRVINNAMPDFNQNLLPPYDLRLGLRDIVSDFSDIIDIMLHEELITYADIPALFVSGTFNYVYFEFESGMKFLGHFEEGDWSIYVVEDYEDARALLNILSRRPPLFIIRTSG